MNLNNVFYPECRMQIIEDQLSKLSDGDRSKYTEVVSLLRKGKRPNDHKFQKTPTPHTWISYLGGSKGGRIIYLKPDKEIIISANSGKCILIQKNLYDIDRLQRVDSNEKLIGE